MRDVFLAQHPLCAQCEREGRTTPATDVDHIQAHRGDPALLRAWSNLEALCHACHSRKTAAGG
jgi:5-methylcytosine-specific restriction enzyme A